MKLTEKSLRNLIREILRVRWRGEEYIVSGDVERDIEALLQRDTDDISVTSKMQGRTTFKDDEGEEKVKASDAAEMIVNQFENQLGSEFIEKNPTLFAKKMANLRDLIDELPPIAFRSLQDAFFQVFNSGQAQAAFDEMFAKPWPASGEASNNVIPNDGVLGSNAFFSVEQPGRKGTMGRGEVMMGLQYGTDGDPLFVLDPKGKFDLSSTKAGKWHVKDLVGASKDISLGKPEDIENLSSYFPIKLINSIDGITPKKFAASNKEQWLEFLKAVVNAMEAGNYDALGLDPGVGTLPQPGDTIDTVIEKSQRALDAVVRNPNSPMGAAQGVIFFKNGNAYVAGVDNISYIRGNGQGINVGVSPAEYGTSVGDMSDISGVPKLPSGIEKAKEMPGAEDLIKKIKSIKKKADEEAKKKAEEEAEAQAGEEAEVEVDSEEEVISESDQSRWQLLAGLKE